MKLYFKHETLINEELQVDSKETDFTIFSAETVLSEGTAKDLRFSRR
jgi:hypothetical protein